MIIIVPTEAGNIVLGIAQIASIEVGGKRGQWAVVSMGDGRQHTAMLSVEAVLSLLDETTSKKRKTK